MPKKTEYCVAVEIGNTLHRSWMPRKAEAMSYAKALQKLRGIDTLDGINAVAVVDCHSDGPPCYEWPEGAARNLL